MKRIKINMHVLNFVEFVLQRMITIMQASIVTIEVILGLGYVIRRERCSTFSMFLASNNGIPKK